MRKPELSGLTGIRFYAALLVYLSHVTIIPGMETLSGTSLLFNAGVVGVSLFFVLSGFILTYNYADVFRSGVSAGNYRRFVWDRLTKIYPVHFATTLMMVPIQAFSPNLPLDWRAVPFHLFLLQCWWPLSKLGSYLNVPSWSISCEWFFYLLAPIAIFCVLGSVRRWVPLVLTAGYTCGLGLFLRHDQSDYVRLNLVSWFAPSRFVEFLVGVFLARVFMTMWVPNPKVIGGVAQTLGIVLVLAGALYRQHAPWPFWGGLLYVPGSVLLVLGLAYGSGFLAAHLSHRWLHTLGTASFSLYMVHAPILRAMKGVWLHFGWEVRSWVGFGMVTLAMFVLVQSSAFLVCYGYELPVQKQLRSLLRRPQERLLVGDNSALSRLGETTGLT